LQISAELVNASDKTQVWGEQYNRTASDLLQVQSEISREISAKLRVRLTAGEQQQLARRETANPRAYELLLQGRFYNNKGGTEDRKKALEYFQQAIAIDPTYAPAHAEESASYSYLMAIGALDPKEFMPRAETAVRKALELDESLAEAHLALANLKVNAWDWNIAEQEYQRAMELNPNLADAHRWYSTYLTVKGRHEQAIAEGKRARELDPLSLTVSADLGFAILFARHYDEAIESLKKTLELDQNLTQALIYLGYAYAAKGMYVEAIAKYQAAIKLNEDSSSTQIYLGAAYAKAGERGKAQAILKRLQTSNTYVSPGELPVLYIALDEKEQAFASLEKAYAGHDLQLQWLGVDPSFDSLRSDPRFQDLLRRVGLPQ
jgi:tetratricopeptide (TPR) repeat protein